MTLFIFELRPFGANSVTPDESKKLSQLKLMKNRINLFQLDRFNVIKNTAQVNLV